MTKKRANESNSVNSNENQREKLHTRFIEPKPLYKARAQYNFYAQTNRELSFKKGDIILVKRRINDDWLEGEHQGLVGIFPINYVELLSYEPNDKNTLNDKPNDTEGEAIVKRDYLPHKAFELQLGKGEKVILLRRINDDWYEARVNKMEGIIPVEYIDIIREPSDQPLNLPNENDNKTSTNTGLKGVLKNSSLSKQPASGKTDIHPNFSAPINKCQVLYDYTPQNPDELEIHAGDIIDIYEMCDDGWYCGIVEKSSHGDDRMFGTFPGNYVKILPS